MKLEDGKGTGRQAGVNIDNMLMTYAITSSIEHRANHEGKAFNALFSQSPNSQVAINHLLRFAICTPTTFSVV